MFDKETMLNMISRQLAEGLNQYPPEIRKALENTEVKILRDETQIRIKCRSLSGNEEEAKQVTQGISNAITPLMVRLIGGFKCKVKYQL